MTLNVLTKLFTNFSKYRFVSRLSHKPIRKVCMHARAIPISISKWFWMVVDRETVLLSCSLQQVASYPNFIASRFSALGKTLEFPLTSRHLCVNTFYVYTRFQADIQVLFYTCPAIGVSSAHRTVVRTLRSRISSMRESRR